MRPRNHYAATFLALGLMLSMADADGADVPTPPIPPLNPGLADRDRMELDLMHAEDRLTRARTPGARRKAQRTVTALRQRLGRAA